MRLAGCLPVTVELESRQLEDFGQLAGQRSTPFVKWNSFVAQVVDS